MKYTLYCLLLLVLAGCIKNDIPYPKLTGDITVFEVSGQIGAAKINKELREVSIEIADTVNIKHVKVLKFEVSNDAVVTPDITEFVDLSAPVTYTLTTFQDYSWTIKCVQKNDRYVKVENQVGDAMFHVDPAQNDYQALVYVSKSQSLTNINILEMKLGPADAVVTPDFTTVHDFSNTVEFTVTYNDVVELWKVTVMRSQADVITGDVNAWAKFADLTGSFIASSSSQPTFEYKKSSDASWTTVPQSSIVVNGNSFSTTITGLEPNTPYICRAVVSGSGAGAEKNFVTEKAEQYPNMSFNNWFKDGRTWYPDIDLSAENYLWDSGNKGANTLKEVNPTTPEETIVVEGKAARLGSKIAAGQFAAGSIFTGEFIGAVLNPLGAKLDFGRPYTARPSKLKGYYRYQPGTIDKAKGDYGYLAGTQDSCIIWVALCDWSGPFRINTATGEFVDVDNDPNILAYGKFVESKTMTAYEPFTIDLVYRDKIRKPTYLIVVASSSKYGDYFTGSTSSVLYIDQFEFEY